jgi:hypothetical protein
MSAAETLTVFRVTVRGRFADLTEQARSYLSKAAPEHDILLSSYSPEESLTYDRAVDFFNIRFELRAAGDNPMEAAGAEGLRETEAFFDTMGWGFRALKVNVVDMSAMWDDVARRQAL